MVSDSRAARSWPTLPALGLLAVGLALGPRAQARTVTVNDHETLVGHLLRPPVPGLEVSFGPALVARAELDADGLHLRNTPLLGRLTFLRTLSLRRARVSSFGFLSAMPRLERVDLSATTIRSLEALRLATRLQELDLSDTAVRDLGPLAGLAHIAHLDIAGTRVTSLGPLRGRRLVRLVLGGRGAWALPDLRALSDVGTLVLREAPRGLDLQPLRTLRVAALDLGALAPPHLDALRDHPTLERLVLGSTRVPLDAVRALLRGSPRLQVVLPDGRTVGRVLESREAPPDPRDYPCILGVGPCAEERFGPRRIPRYRFILP